VGTERKGSRNVGTEAFLQLVVISPFLETLTTRSESGRPLRRRAGRPQLKRDPLGGRGNPDES